MLPLYGNQEYRSAFHPNASKLAQLTSDRFRKNIFFAGTHDYTSTMIGYEDSTGSLAFSAQGRVVEVGIQLKSGGGGRVSIGIAGGLRVERTCGHGEAMT
jgi:hypothetical protein